MKEFLRRPVVAYLLAAVLIASGVSIAANPVPATAEPGCADVKFFGLRGSGEQLVTDKKTNKILETEPANMGQIVIQDTYYQFESEMKQKGLTVAPEAILYPAVKADWKNAFKMEPSVAAGLNLLVKQFNEAIQQCPDQKFVLAGYSQGAWVIKRFLIWLNKLSSSLQRKIGGVLRHGDPTLYRFDHTLYPPRPGIMIGGVAGAQDSPSWVTGRSYCQHADPVCHIDPANMVWCTSVGWDNRCGHLRYQEFVQESASWLASLFSRSSQPRPTPTRPTPEPTRPTPTQPAPVTKVEITELLTTDDDDQRKNDFQCTDPILFHYSVNNKSNADVSGQFELRAFGKQIRQGAVTIKPGTQGGYIESTVPTSSGSQEVTVKININGQEVSRSASFTTHCPG